VLSIIRHSYIVGWCLFIGSSDCRNGLICLFKRINARSQHIAVLQYPCRNPPVSKGEILFAPISTIRATVFNRYMVQWGSFPDGALNRYQEHPHPIRAFCGCSPISTAVGWLSSQPVEVELSFLVQFIEMLCLRSALPSVWKHIKNPI
jgi:hypothetical protein